MRHEFYSHPNHINLVFARDKDSDMVVSFIRSPNGWANRIELNMTQAVRDQYLRPENRDNLIELDCALSRMVLEQYGYDA